MAERDLRRCHFGLTQAAIDLSRSKESFLLSNALTSACARTIHFTTVGYVDYVEAIVMMM